MITIGNTKVYEGLILIDENGTMYREVTEEDLRNGKNVFEVQMKGLEYVQTISAVAKLILDLHLVRDHLAGEDRVHWAAKPPFDVLGTATVQDFTGQSRQKGIIPNFAYFVIVA